MKFAVEEYQLHPERYKRVHLAGCDHLIDPEPVESEPDINKLLYDLDGYEVASDVDELRAMLAPCALQAVQAADVVNPRGGLG